MNYRVEFSVAGLAMYAICFFFIQLHYANKTKATKVLSRFVVGLFIADLLDIITAYTVSYTDLIPIWANYALMIALYISGSVCMTWISEYVGYLIEPETGIKNLADKISYSVLGCYTVLCITTPFTHWIIYFDENNVFTFGKLHILIYIMPLYFFLLAAVRVVKNIKKYTKRQIVTTLSFIVVVSIGALLQMTVLSNYLIIYFAGAISIFMILISIETSDNFVLQKTLDELKKNRELLEKAKDREETINKVIHEMTKSASWGLTFDENFNVVDAYWSDEFFWMLGYDRDELGDKVTSIWVDSLHPEDKEKTVSAFNGGIEGTEEYNVKYRLKDAKGEYKWYRGSGELKPDAEGKGFFYAGIIREINDEVIKEMLTKEKLEALDELEKSQHDLEKAVIKAESADRAKSDFLANMSHEIRTPINAVLGMNELIRRESNEENIIKYSENVASAGQALLALINDILDFSKIEAGRMEITPIDYELAEVIDNVKSMLSLRFAEKGLEFRIECNPNIPNKLYGDEIRIRQIFVNILTNALKYTDKGSVTLSFDFEEKAVDCIELIAKVKDTGIGIKQENIPFLFDSFKRIDLDHNRKIEGSGLGLSITKSFVEMMEGSIEVESVYGEGSCFTVRIPQKVTGQELVGKLDNVTTSKKGRYEASFKAPNARILVVDDVDMNLTVIKGLLKQTLVNIDTVTSGAACLEAIQNTKYDLILLDHMMPEMDGVETMRRIQEDKEHINQGIPVVMLTANAVVGAREEYMELGFVDYLSKPVKFVELEETLKKYIIQES